MDDVEAEEEERTSARNLAKNDNRRPSGEDVGE